MNEAEKKLSRINLLLSTERSHRQYYADNDMMIPINSLYDHIAEIVGFDMSVTKRPRAYKQ